MVEWYSKIRFSTKGSAGMKINKISAEQFNAEDKNTQPQIIKQYAIKAAPANLLKGVNIVAEWILELPFDFMELAIAALQKNNKKYRVYPKEDMLVIAVQF
jgi:hypothetical protein